MTGGKRELNGHFVSGGARNPCGPIRNILPAMAKDSTITLLRQFFSSLQVRAMEGKWTSTSFVATETRLLYDLISLIKKKQPYER